MKYVVSTSLYCFLILISFTNCDKNVPSYDHQISEVDSILSNFRSQELFNGGILLAKSDKVLFSKSYGYANIDKSIPLTEKTVFQSASISKTFTAVAILQLIEQKKLYLNDQLIDFFPNLPYPDITIKHLLTHTSGLYPYNPLFKKSWNKDSIATNEDIIMMYENTKPEQFFTAGTEFSYSNVGYVFLSSIVEQISGVSFEDYLEKNVFAPTEMNNSQVYTLLSEFEIQEFAQEHILDPISGTYTNPLKLDYHKEVFYLNGKVGDDKVATTLNDLWKWNRSLFNYQILPKEILEMAFRSQISEIDDSLRHSPFDYGLGFQLGKTEHFGKVIYHNGGEPGIRSRFLYYPDHDLSLIIYANAHSEYLNKIRDIIVAIMFDREYEIPKKSFAPELYKVAKNGNESIYKVVNQYKNDTTYTITENEINRLAGIFWTKEIYDIGFNLLELNVKLFPNSISARYTLGEGYMETGDYTQAIIHFNLAIEMMLQKPIENQNMGFVKFLEELIEEIANMK